MKQVKGPKTYGVLSEDKDSHLHLPIIKNMAKMDSTKSEKELKCLECGSNEMMSQTHVIGSGTVDLNNQVVDEVDYAEFELEDVETAYCLNCYAEYEVESTVSNNKIELQLKGRV